MNERLGGGAIVENSHGEVWLGKRTTKTGFGEWALPGGKIEDDDPDVIIGILRETFEESGIDGKGIVIMGVVSIDHSPVNNWTNFGLWIKTDEEAKVVDPKEIGEWRLFKIEELADILDDIFLPSRISIADFLVCRQQFK